MHEDKDSDASRLKFLKKNMEITVNDDTLNVLTEMDSQFEL